MVKPNWKHDTNLTIHILVLTLIRVAEKGPLPRVLYLQMDNCWRENKNQCMFTFLALLVKLGIFKKVKVNFDLVGHKMKMLCNHKNFSMVALPRPLGPY